MRSAAVWGLGQLRSEPATRKLVELFTDTQQQLRQEALDRVVSIGRGMTPILIERLLSDDSAIAAGCAEALRQLRPEAPELIAKVNKTFTGQTPLPWPVWLIGNLPKAEFAPEVAKLQNVEPEVHYTINLLWAFTDSWISQRWERDPNPDSRPIGDANAV
jgi:HEAT repeat protein